MNYDRNKLLTRDGKLPLCNPKWLVQYSDLMHFSEGRWLLLTVSRKSQPPLFILLFNSIECLLYLRRTIFPPPPLASCVFPMRDERRLQFILKSRTNGFFFMYASDLWGQGSSYSCRYIPSVQIFLFTL